MGVWDMWGPSPWFTAVAACFQSVREKALLLPNPVNHSHRPHNLSQVLNMSHWLILSGGKYTTSCTKTNHGL